MGDIRVIHKSCGLLRLFILKVDENIKVDNFLDIYIYIYIYIFIYIYIYIYELPDLLQEDLNHINRSIAGNESEATRASTQRNGQDRTPNARFSQNFTDL